MKILNTKRCVIGEGPIWNPIESKLYFTNGMGMELCTYDFVTDTVSTRKLPIGAAAYAFDKGGRLIVSHADGVDFLEADGTLVPIYDREKFQIQYANDMKVGPDGAIYVGTQSERRKGLSDKLNGRLYRISRDGEVRVLLDGLILSNGMEWSLDESKFYHTDSDTHIIREYDFDIHTGSISPTGRFVECPGVDGFTVGRDGNLYVGCWGKGHVAVVDTVSIRIADYIPLPVKIPSSCGFCGADMDILAITTASYRADVSTDENAGYTLLYQTKTQGRLPYLYG